MASNGLPCPLCDAVLYDENTFQRHVDTHLSAHDIRGGSALLDMASPVETSSTDTREPLDISSQVKASSSTATKEHSSSTDMAAKEHRCHLCSMVYTAKRSLMRHIRAKHDKQLHRCSKCEKTFKYRSDATRNEKACDGQISHVCPRCHKRCSSAQGLRRHLKWHTQVKQVDDEKRKRGTPSFSTVSKPKDLRKEPRATSIPNQYRCRRCCDTFDNRHDLYLHGMRAHYQIGGALQQHPWGQPHMAPWQNEDDTLNEGLRAVYQANSPIILGNHNRGPVQSVYNFPLNNEVTLNQLMEFAETVFREQHHAFRLNLVFGVILRHRETGQYRYFVPYTNNGILERPLYVSRRADLQRLRRQLELKDITTELLRNRPDTKWVPVLVTNVRFPVWSTHYPIGQGPLPDYLLRKDSLFPLVKSRQTDMPYEDQLCAFRCLALHHGHEICCIDGPAHTYFRQWTNGKEEDEFNGLGYDEIPEFEMVFGVNLEAYSLEEDGFARSVYKSRGQQETTMYVNIYENHLSYIRNFPQYAQKYQCHTCGRHFEHAGHLHRHQKSCDNKTKYVFPGGFHRARESIFDQLDQYGINVPADDRIFPWFICYDFEALLKKIEDRPTESLAWTQKHVPVSVSICSNVEGHRDPVCLVDSDPDQLVQSMVSAISEVADSVYEYAEAKWGWILE